uniref:7TM_GPCR_Srx domain-containing protein n=1 Tax=Steinernema glaseri TaxID=37863 RepID=A0A1I7Z989_9BILA
MLLPGVAAALMYMTEFFIIVPLHVVLLVILLRGQEFKKLTAYKIMTHMSICECTQMIGYLMGDVMSISQTTFHPYVARVGGSFLNAGWIGIVTLTFLLNLNRFIVFIGFKMTAQSERRFYNIMLLFTWTIAALVFAAHMTPDLSMIYIIERNTFWFVDTPLAKVGGKIEYFYLSITLFCTFVVCVATVTTIIVKRNLYSAQFKISAGEIKVFVQSLIIFLYLTMIRCAWQFLSPIMSGEAQFIALGIATQAVGGLNPLLYCSMNKTIRRHLFKMIGLKKYTTTVSTVITLESSSNRKP